MYAIFNNKSKKYLVGTDYSHENHLTGSYPQFTSPSYMLTYDTASAAQKDVFKRKCGKNYEVVRIKWVRQPLLKEDLGQVKKEITKWNEETKDED